MLPDHEHNFEEQLLQPLFHEPGPRYFFGAVPMFLVDDVVATCEYYRDVLGFTISFVYGEPAYFACVMRDNALINIVSADPAGARNSASAGGDSKAFDAYLIVIDLDGIFDELKARGATIIRERESQVYGMREFQIEDCNHYRLTLGQGMFEAHL